MKIVVIGSTHHNCDEMRDIKDYFEKRGNDVVTPVDDGRQDKPLIVHQKEYIDFISEADMVIACSKYHNYSVEDDKYSGEESVEFGESTSYEIAIAKFLGKPVLYWRGMVSC